MSSLYESCWGDNLCKIPSNKLHESQQLTSLETLNTWLIQRCCASGQTGKHLCRQQCVLVCEGLNPNKINCTISRSTVGVLSVNRWPIFRSSNSVVWLNPLHFNWVLWYYKQIKGCLAMQTFHGPAGRNDATFSALPLFK